MASIVAMGCVGIAARALGGCVSADNALLKTVPVGSGTSHLAPYDFTKCVKSAWTPLDRTVREYSLSADTQAVSIPGKGYASQSVVLAVAQQSAKGHGLYRVGDIAVATTLRGDGAHLRLISARLAFFV